jgi:hypothetical protein
MNLLNFIIAYIRLVLNGFRISIPFAEYIKFKEAQAYVESGNNPHAIGDGGNSFGLLQIHQGYGKQTIQNAIGKTIKNESLLDGQTNIYYSMILDSINQKIIKSKGREVNLENIAIIYNSGVKGLLDPNGIGTNTNGKPYRNYFRKIKEEMLR